MKHPISLDFSLDLGDLGEVEATVEGYVEVIDGRASAKVLWVSVPPSVFVVGRSDVCYVRPTPSVIEELEIVLSESVLLNREGA